MWIGKIAPSFLGGAAQIIRRVLVDHARPQPAQERPSAVRVGLFDEIGAAEGVQLDDVALDHALSELAQLDPQQEKIIELRFFAGPSIEETSEALNSSLLPRSNAIGSLRAHGSTAR